MAAVFGALGSLLTPNKEQEPPKMLVTNDAIENGEVGTVHANQTPATAISSADVQIQNQNNSVKCPDVREKAKNVKSQQKGDVLTGFDAPTSTGDKCGMCQKSITIKQAAGCAKCGFCDGIFCNDCSHFTPHMCKNVLERADILWACYTCLPRLENAKLATPVESSTDTIEEGKLSMVNFEELKGEINCVISEKVVPQLITKIEQSMNTLSENIKQWNNIPYASAAEGDSSDGSENPPEESFPEDGLSRVMSKKERKAAVRQSKEYTESVKIAQAALASQKEDEERQKNILVYRLPETVSSAEEARKNEKEQVKKLLDALEVNASPVEIKRLGKFNKDTVKEKPRPIKIVFGNKISRDEAINNARNLGKIQDENLIWLKNLQICYDLNKEQREQQKAKIDEAKELSKNSETHVWRVRGTPGNMFLKKFEKKTKP